MAALNSGSWRNLLWSSNNAFGDDECARVAQRFASGAALSRGAGDHLLVGCLRRRLRCISGPEYALRLRQTMVTGLDLLFLEVNNLEESLLFYREQLGFEIVSQNLAAEPPIATVGAGSLRITLVQQLETMLKRGRGAHFVLGVSNVDQFHQKLAANGTASTEPRDEGWGGRFVSLQDPDGYRFFFVTWESRGS